MAFIFLAVFFLQTLDSFPQGAECIANRVDGISRGVFARFGSHARRIKQNDVYKTLAMARDDFNNVLKRLSAKACRMDEAKRKAKEAGLKQGWWKG